MASTPSPRTYRVKSFGCQMNVYDGERMAELLGAQGIAPAPDGEDADLVVLNTCHIREKAAEKVYSDIGRLRRDDGTSPLIAVAGCVAHHHGKSAVDFRVLREIVLCHPRAGFAAWAVVGVEMRAVPDSVQAAPGLDDAAPHPFVESGEVGLRHR